MTMVVDDRAGEIARYLDAVRDALRDLPPQQRDELLEDLPEHLAEVAAEEPTPLAEQLGPPEAYAAELRAAVGPAGRRRPLRDRLRMRWEPTLAGLRRLDRRLGPMIGYPKLSHFGRLLAPAWWVLRGYVAAMVVVNVLDPESSLGMLPRLGGSTLVGLVVLAAFVIGSIWLARRTPGLSRPVRRGVHLASAALVVFGLAGLAGMDASLRWMPTYNYSGTDYDPNGHIEDVYVFDQDGNLVPYAILRDQTGMPIELGYVWCGDGLQTGWTYPRCPDDLPWWMPESAVGPDTSSREPTGSPDAGPRDPATPDVEG